MGLSEFEQTHLVPVERAAELAQRPLDVAAFEAARAQSGYRAFAGFLAIEGYNRSVEALLRAAGISADYLARVNAAAGPFVMNDADGTARRYNGIMLYQRDSTEVTDEA